MFMADISPDRLQSMLQSGMGGAAPTGAATPAEATPGPMAAPMSTPEPKMGNKEGAMVNLAMALDLIEQAIPSLGSESDEGQKAMAAIRSLSGLLGPKKPRTNELQPAEILQLLGSLPQAGNVTPEVAAVLGPRPSTPTKPVIPPPSPGGAPMPGGMPGGPMPGGIPGAPPM